MSSVSGGRPKGLVRVNGRPLLERLIRDVETAVVGICVVTPPGEAGGRELELTFKSFRPDVRFATVVQPERRGVADAVVRCRDIVEGPFVVVMGDVCYDPPVAPYLTALRAAGPPSVLVEPAGAPSSDPMGVVTVRDGHVVEIEKRPLRASDRFRVAGAFCFPDDGFAAFEAARPSRGEFELEMVVNRMMTEREVYAVVYDGWRRNVNTPGDLRAVRERFR